MSDIHSKDKDLFTIRDLQAWQAPPVRKLIWDGVLNVGHKFQIFGDEGSWKSMLAMHLMYSITSGRRWLGFKTSPANVLYIQGEMGMYSVQSRSLKYCCGTKDIYLHKPGDVPNELARAEAIAYPSNAYTQVVQFFHIDEQAGIASLRRKLDTVISESPDLPILLILDPLYKMFHHDLKDDKDVSYFCDNMDLVLYDYNQIKNSIQRQLALVFVHHSRKVSTDPMGNRTPQGSDESFGAKKLSWWSDTVLNTTLDKEDETVTTVNLTFTKHGRDAEVALPKLIKTRWDRATLHPRILARIMPESPEDELESRGTDGYAHLE